MDVPATCREHINGKDLLFSKQLTLKMPRHHFSSSHGEEPRRERKRTRRRRARKEKAQKLGQREQNPPATFPIIVDRTKTSPSLRQRNKKYHSPEPLSSSHSGYESVEYSDSQEFYLDSAACLNREAATYSSRSKLPMPKTIAELPQPKKRSRKKKEEHTHSLYPTYLERPPSRNGIGFARDSPYRSMDPIPARKSLESMPGFSDKPEMRCIKKPKLPPIADKENRSHTDDHRAHARTHTHTTDEYTFVRRF